ncbi:hypothetical protein Tco_1074981 [Tanacetum coccineum]
MIPCALPKNESTSLDHFDDPSLPRPPPEPPDVEICFNFEPDAGVVTKKVVGDISEHDVLMPNLLPTQPTLCPVFDLLLPFSSENEDKVFNPDDDFWRDILIPSLMSRISHFYHLLDQAQVWGSVRLKDSIPQDHEDSCLFSILQSSGLRSFAYFGILNPDHPMRLGCAETKFATWDDLALKLNILGWNVKHRILHKKPLIHDNSLPEFKTFINHTEETRSGSTTTHANNSLPEYDSFLFEIEPDQGGLTGIFISDNSNNPLLEFPEFESFHFDLDPSFPHPPLEPPDV